MFLSHCLNLAVAVLKIQIVRKERSVGVCVDATFTFVLRQFSFPATSVIDAFIHVWKTFQLSFIGCLTFP